MASKNGAKPGEVCAFCGDPMNAGFNVCSDCGAERTTPPTAITTIGAFAAGWFAWVITPGVSLGVRIGIVFATFVVVMALGPKKVVYKRKTITGQ